MKLQGFSTAWLVASALALGALTAQADTEGKAQAKAQWKPKMQELRTVIGSILKDISSDQRFDAPGNRKQIEQNAKKLSDLAHDLKKAKMAPSDADPTLTIIGGLFDEETKHAYQELKRGNRDYARGILRAVTSYCIACHTRDDSGPSFNLGEGQDDFVKSLDRVERGEFYASTRQFEKALFEFQSAVSDPEMIRSQSLFWERALRYGLAIVVRVKQDPALAEQLIARVEMTKGVPIYLKAQAKEWKQSVEEWKKEASRKPTSVEGWYAEAVRLTALARNKQKYPADRSADIIYLRSTSAIHELLKASSLKGKYVSEGLLLAGMNYQVLRDVYIWDLHEFYFLGCIEASPQTEIARQCFKQYEESVYSGYSGSGGVSLPPDVMKKLMRYHELSEAPATQKVN